MNIAEFNYKRDHFPYEACALSWNEKIWMREEFTMQFTSQKIANMTIEEYVVGSGDKTTFCYGIGHGLNQLAHVGNLFPTSFGVYYNKEKKNYVTDKKRWDDPEKALGGTRCLSLCDEQRGQAMSQLQVQWMEAAKFARYLFLALPFALLIIMPLVELVSGVVVVAFITVMMLIGLLKGKLF